MRTPESSRLRRRRGWRWSAAAVVVVVASGGTVGRAAASEADARLIFSLSAGGSGVALTYDRKNLLPVSPLADMGFPRVSLQLDDSPSSTARAVAFDPGVLGAGNALSQIFGAPPGAVPAYPLYADARFPTGPSSASAGAHQPAGTGGGAVDGFSGSASAEAQKARGSSAVFSARGQGQGGTRWRIPVPGESEADVRALHRDVASLLARSGHLAVPVKEPSGDMVAIDNGSVVGEAGRAGTGLSGKVVSTVGGVELLGGLVRIGRMVTTAELSWPSPTVSAKPTVTSSLTDVTVLGVPAIIDRDGIRIQSQGAPAPETGAVRKAFAAHGATFGAGTSAVRPEGVSGNALTFGFNGQVQPGETDSFELDFARVWFSYVAELEGGQAAPAVPEAGSAAPGSAMAVSRPVTPSRREPANRLLPAAPSRGRPLAAPGRSEAGGDVRALPASSRPVLARSARKLGYGNAWALWPAVFTLLAVVVAGRRLQRTAWSRRASETGNTRSDGQGPSYR